MKKVNAVSNTSASTGKTGKSPVQNSLASGDSQKSSAVKRKQPITNNQPSENQERYYELFNLINSGVAVYKAVDKGKDFVFTDFNPAAEKIERTTRKKVIGRKVTEMFPGIREMSLLKTFRRVWRTGSPEYHPEAVYKGEHLESWRENYVYKLPSGEIMAIYEDITERKKVEAELRESEDRFRSLYESATIGLYRTTPDGKILIANQALVKMLGFESVDELTRRNLNKEGFETSSARKEFQRQIEANGEVHGYESTWKTTKGSTLFVRESARVVRDKSGKVLYYEGTVEDTSERQKAESALRENENFLNSVIENIPNMIIVKDARDLSFVRFNKAGEELLGVSRQEMDGKTDRDFWSKEEADFFIKKDRETLTNKEMINIPEEKILTRKKGDRILHTKKIPILDESGSPKYLLLISEDITEQKKAEETLRESEERFRGLFEDSPVSLWLEDFSAVKQRLDALRVMGVKDIRAYLESHPEEVYTCVSLTRVVDVNKAGLSLLKAKKKEDLLGNLSKILSPESFKEFRQELIYLAEGKTKFSWEGKSLTLTGELLDTSLTWSVVQGYEKDLSKVLLSIVDITKSKRMAVILRESEERFRSLFEDSPVSLWEEDFSAVKQRLAAFKAKGVTDLQAYLVSHPEEVMKCASLIKILDVNKAAIKLYGARDKEHLFRNLAKVVSNEHTGKFVEEVVNISNGLTRFNYETVNQAIGGEKINISISWAAAPGHEKDLSRVLISIVDITERKRAEAKLDYLITELRELSEKEKKNRIFAEALAKNVSVINSSLKAEQVMDSIIESIGEIVPYDAASVMMVTGQQVRIVRSKGYRERGLEKWVEQAQFDLNKIKDFNSIIRSKKYKVTPNTETSQDWTKVAETAWVKSHITSPLIEGSQVIGFFNLDSATPGFYSEEHANVLMSFSEQVSTALKNARQFEETQRRMDRMHAMTQIDLAINSSLDISVSLEIVLIQAKDKLNADAVDILQVNKGTNSLVFSKAKGFKTDEVRKANFKLGTGLPGKAVLERDLIAIPNLRSAPESYFRNLLVEREGFASYYCAPLITKGELKGVIEIYFRDPFEADQEWCEFLEMLAQLTAIAINNAELLNSLKVSNADLMNAYETTMKGWVDALDMRDHETEGHTRRVTELSLQLALRMGIKDSEIVNFERGALLHDIGKVGISDAILKKPGPLTEEEWVIMRQHPLNALSLLTKSKYLLPALDIPYCHHEKWDGSGYPRGLKGEAIPLAARIFAVVDVWDALTSDRPYRKAWTQKQAQEHIQEQSGKHFDPKIVSAFMALPKTGIK